MSINSESEIAANLQIGPTDRGMVRIYVEAEGVDLPLDFDPEEAEEIAEELLAAAEAARGMERNAAGPDKGDTPKKPRR
jgi:hypothetical protein